MVLRCGIVLRSCLVLGLAMLARALERQVAPAPGSDATVETTADQLRKLDDVAKPKAYIHIGSHKVGSTYIQRMLVLYRDQLAAAGRTVPFPVDCDPYHGGVKVFATIAAALRSGDTSIIPNESIEKHISTSFSCGTQTAGSVATLRETLASIEGDVVLSAEDFDALRPQDVRYLADILKAYDVRILVMYREVLDHIVSVYAEALHQQQHLGKTSVMLDLPQFMLSGGVSSAVWYPEIITTYASVFGAQAVSVASYEGLRHAEVDLIDFVFGSFLGLSAETVAGFSRQSHGAANTSPSPEAMSLWAFIQDVWLIQRTERAVPPFPWDGKSSAECKDRITAEMITLLGAAWQCPDARLFVNAVMQRDLDAIRSYGGPTFYFDEMGQKGRYFAPSVQLCYVQRRSLDLEGRGKLFDAVLALADEAITAPCVS